MSKVRNVNQDSLKEKGRLQFFYHSKSSQLPIRDVRDEHGQGPKTEPHIEIGAENYLNPCVQSSINSFAKSDEKYLFLFTNCSNCDLPDYKNKRFIVGYIVKEIVGETRKKLKSGCNTTNSKPFTFVKGKTYLFKFKDALSFEELKLKKFRASKLLDVSTTQKILLHFKGKTNVINECVDEIKRLDPDNITCYKDKSGFQCNFENECLRWNT